MICRECKQEFDYGNYIDYSICDECVYDITNGIFPSDGDTCPICDSAIKYGYTREYQSLYYCSNCDREWWYD